MKRPVFIIFISVLCLFSCEEELEYRSKTDRIYIDARITNHIEDSYVWISAINAFPDTSTGDGLSGATIMISDDNGNQEVLYETVKNGMYKLKELEGIPNHTYTLTVEINGETYTSNSTMLKANRNFVLLVHNGTDWVSYNHNNDNDKTDHYRIRLFKNDSPQYDLYRIKLFSTVYKNSSLGKGFRTGDRVRVELYSLPAEAYNYYETIFQALTNVSEDIYSRPVYFPEGNIEGAAGIFRASEVVSKEIIFDTNQ